MAWEKTPSGWWKGALVLRSTLASGEPTMVQLHPPAGRKFICQDIVVVAAPDDAAIKTIDVGHENAFGSPLGVPCGVLGPMGFIRGLIKGLPCAAGSTIDVTLSCTGGGGVEIEVAGLAEPGDGPPDDDTGDTGNTGDASN